MTNNMKKFFRENEDIVRRVNGEEEEEESFKIEERRYDLFTFFITVCGSVSDYLSSRIIRR